MVACYELAVSWPLIVRHAWIAATPVSSWLHPATRRRPTPLRRPWRRPYPGSRTSPARSSVDTAAAPVCAFRRCGASAEIGASRSARSAMACRASRRSLIPFATSVMAALGVCTSSSRFVSLLAHPAGPPSPSLAHASRSGRAALWSASTDRPSRSTRCGSPSRSPDTRCPQPNAAGLVVSHVVPLVEGKRRELDRRDVCPGGPTGQRRAPDPPDRRPASTSRRQLPAAARRSRRRGPPRLEDNRPAIPRSPNCSTSSRPS